MSAQQRWLAQSFLDTQLQDHTPIQRVNILDTANIMYVCLVVPGVSPGSIDVDFYNNTIFIKGVMTSPISESSCVEITREFGYGEFERRIEIPICVSSRDSVSIKLDLGILCIMIDKTVEERNMFRVRLPGVSRDEEYSEDEDEDEDETQRHDNGSVS